MLTEADEAAHGCLQTALRNIAFKVVFGETQGVIEHYADAARRLGASQDQIDRAMRR